MSDKIFLNIACGNIYVDTDDWINIDISSDDKKVKKINLLDMLPFADSTVDVIYCAHFLEHIPLDKINFFLLECFRILKKNGIIRLVLPDFEALAKEYLKQVNLKNFIKANIILTLIIDQCVRKKPGGQLGLMYKNYLSNKDKYINEIKYINFLNGVNFLDNNSNKKKIFFFIKRKIIFLLKEKLLRSWINFIIFFLPKSFIQQNISKTQIGELHHWIWDYYSLKNALKITGFNRIKKQSYDTTECALYNLCNFDTNNKGEKSRGIESMYVECIK